MQHPELFDDEAPRRRARREEPDPSFRLDSEADVPQHIITQVNHIHPVSPDFISPTDMQAFIDVRRIAITALMEKDSDDDDALGSEAVEDLLAV